MVINFNRCILLRDFGLSIALLVRLLVYALKIYRNVIYSIIEKLGLVPELHVGLGSPIVFYSLYL